MVNSRSDVGEGDQVNAGSKELRDKNNEDIEIEPHIVEEVKIRKLNTDKMNRTILFKMKPKQSRIIMMEM